MLRTERRGNGLARGLIRLGPYEVLSPLGSGGMGEVWKARDTRLDREVAIKVLPEAMAGPESLERFKREAKAASVLNHPHICAVFDAGEHEGRPFLVLERLRDQTLREAIGGKALPVERVLDLGAQVADALEAAHGAGSRTGRLSPRGPRGRFEPRSVATAAAPPRSPGFAHARAAAQRSSGFSPVSFAIWDRILGPISSSSW